MTTRALAAIALLLLVGCTVTPPAGALPPTPAATVTVTAMAHPADEPSEEPTVEPSEEPSVEPTGWSGEDVADRSAGQHTREADVARWTLVNDLFDASNKAGKPVTARFHAVLRYATYDSNGKLSVSFDRVKWNPKWSDGSDVDILLNPQVKWETLTSGHLLVMVNPGDGAHQMPAADLPKYLKAEAARAKEYNDGWMTPFTVYYVGNKPVALVEWYMP